MHEREDVALALGEPRDRRRARRAFRSAPSRPAPGRARLSGAWIVSPTSTGAESSAPRAGAFSEVTSERSMSSRLVRRSSTVVSSSAASSGLGRHRAGAGEVGVAGPLDPPALPPNRARGPVLLAQLVDEGAGDARPGVLLEAGSLDGIEAVDRFHQRDEAGRREIVELAVRRQLANLARGDVANHRRVGEDELVTRARVPPAPSSCARALRPRDEVSRWDVLVAVVLRVADIRRVPSAIVVQDVPPPPYRVEFRSSPSHVFRLVYHPRFG